MQSLTTEKKKPLSVKFKAMFGYRHVPDNTLQIIERHGRYHRAEAGPFVRRNALSESFGDPIRLGLVVVDHLYDNIISADGVAHKIGVMVKVYFDLRQADETIAPIIAKRGLGIVENRLMGLVDLALRRVVATLTSTQLLAPDIPLELEAAIKRRLQAMTMMGATLITAEDGLVVKEILPPERMHENRTEATNIDETISSFTRKTPPQLKQALLAHLLRDIGKQRPYFKGLHIPEDMSLPDDDVLDASYRVLRQPTGRIYDN